MEMSLFFCGSNGEGHVCFSLSFLFPPFHSIPASFSALLNVRPRARLEQNPIWPVACLLMAALKQPLVNCNFHQKSAPFSSSSQQFSWTNRTTVSISNGNSFEAKKITYCSTNRRNIYCPRAESGKDGIVPVEDDDDGVSLGTMKLPGNTDLAQFETLLFQWANSLCQGANIPLPMPLKVDKIQGGARLGFIEIDQGKTEVLVYIDCIVCQAPDGTGPVFRAIRNGPLKDQTLPGEPTIMRRLLQALQKSVQIARV